MFAYRENHFFADEIVLIVSRSFFVYQETMQPSAATPRDLTWVVAYLTELVNTNFEELVTELRGQPDEPDAKQKKTRRNKRKVLCGLFLFSTAHPHVTLCCSGK